MTPAPILAVRGLTAPLETGGTPALPGVDFAVAAGERVLLTGPSGSGKSTLLRAMVLLEPAEGSVLLDGEEVGPERVRALRRRIGYVPQRPVSIAATIEENLAFPRSLGGDVLDAGAQDALLERLGLEGVDRSRRFDSLSGGEQQRVALVRSLTVRPRVLLLDEPTASLDQENVEDVVALFREWAEEDETRALVWVSHQTDPVRELATRRVRLEELKG